MASLANVGKSVGLTTFIATQPAFHRSFARGENLADISAKAQVRVGPTVIELAACGWARFWRMFSGYLTTWALIMPLPLPIYPPGYLITWALIMPD